MSLEKWARQPGRSIEPTESTRVVVEHAQNTHSSRFIIQIPDGEIFIAQEDEEVLRLSMQRANGTYCVFELPTERIIPFFQSGKYNFLQLRDAIYEDPVESGLTRDGAMEILGIDMSG